MKGSAVRSFLRVAHIVLGLIIGTYIYSPWSSNIEFAMAVKFVVIPLLLVTGVAMWKQGKLMKVLRSGSVVNER